MNAPAAPIPSPHTFSGYHGVGFNPQCRRRPFVARLWHHGRILYLGYYASPEAAARRVAQALRIIGRAPWQKPRKSTCQYGHSLLLPGRAYEFRDNQGYLRRICKHCEAVRQAQKYARRSARQ